MYVFLVDSLLLILSEVCCDHFSSQFGRNFGGGMEGNGDAPPFFNDGNCWYLLFFYACYFVLNLILRC
eukprot:m.70918 g.70918  ORF g.70918 m.70918 type:complete len:68 (-) comp8328_c0_seq1:249-452(-)